MCGTTCADHCGAQSFHYDLYCSGPVSFNLYRGLKLQVYWHRAGHPDPDRIIFLAIVVQPNQPFLQDYQQERILAFLEPEKYADDGAYQQRNSVMAIGSGQLTGKGLNNNTTDSVKNGDFILEPSTDFIFAIVGENLVHRKLYYYCFIIINCDTMYIDWNTIAEPVRADHLLRRGRPDRDTKLY